MILVLITFLFINIMKFINSDTVFIIIPSIIWFIPSVIGLMCVCFCPFCVVIGFYLYSEYLILAFKQINHKLYVFIRFRKIALLRNTIIEHYFLSKICYLYNNTMKYFIFILYFLCTPIFGLGIMYIQSRETIMFLKIIIIIFLLLFIMVLFLSNYECARLNTAAHKSLNKLLRLYTNRCLTIRDKLFVQLFMERLSGPDIGFYCLDLFPMNNFKFAEYVINFFAIYVLLSEIFR